MRTLHQPTRRMSLNRPTPVLPGTDELTDNSISNGDTDNAGTRYQSDDTDVLRQKSESSDAPLDLRVLNLWRAIGDDRLGIAYHTARLTPEEDRTSAVFPPADLIAATALGNSVYGPEGEIVKELENHFNAIGRFDPLRHESPRESSRRAQSVVILCCTTTRYIRPANRCSTDSERSEAVRQICVGIRACARCSGQSTSLL